MNRLPAHLVAAALAVACIDASAADPVQPRCVDSAQSLAKGSSGPRQTVPAEGTAAVSSVGNLAGGAGGGAAAASYAKVESPPSGMPARISMNVTVPKQTQGATFGEKVNQGLHAAGGAIAQGASAAPGEPGCAGDNAIAPAAKEKSGQSDASAGAGAATAAAMAEKQADRPPTAVPDHK